MITPDTLKSIVEAALFASDQPLSVPALQALFVHEMPPEPEAIEAALQSLTEDYAHRGVQLKSLSKGYRFQVAQSVSPWVAELWEEPPAKCSRALLETLALVAYRQPITRSEIEAVRGVSVSSHIMKTLLERGWVRVVGHRDVPGRPALYATTALFLDDFNLTCLDELPSLMEVKTLDELPFVLEADSQVAEIESIQDESMQSEALGQDEISEASD